MKVICLEESGDGEEEGVNLIFGERLALVEEVDEFGENLNTFLGIYFSIVEAFGLHDGVGFIYFYYGVFGLFCSGSEILLPCLDEGLDHIGVAFHGTNIYLFFKTNLRVEMLSQFYYYYIWTFNASDLLEPRLDSFLPAF